MAEASSLVTDVPLWQEMCVREAEHVWGRAGGKSPYLSFSFTVNLKLF